MYNYEVSLNLMSAVIVEFKRNTYNVCGSVYVCVCVYIFYINLVF